MKRIRIIAAVLLAALIIFAVAILAVRYILLPMVICPGGWFCTDWDVAPAALAAEHDAVQAGMDIMMTDRNLTTVDEHATGPAVNDWTSFPTGTGAVTLANTYVDLTTSKHYYCWDARGEVYPRSVDSDVAKMPGECSPEP